jgi:hypothetical protein
LRDGLRAMYATQLQRHGCVDTAHALDRLELDVELNAQGLGIWLDRASKAPKEPASRG